jgi:hypothetical protein
MPHVGRPYPFHPIYWATEAWFYPGFVPWKLGGDMGFTLIPPWNLVPDGWIGVSKAGEPSADRKTMTYLFDVVPDDDSLQIKVAMQWQDHPMKFYARWDVWLLLRGAWLIHQWENQQFPQRQVEVSEWVAAEKHPPLGPGFPGPLAFWAADYAEGGTPFEHPTGGPPPHS